MIPILNEEKNISDCLDSVSWAEEVFVVDSQSTDRTCEIAQQYGAKVVQFQFEPGGPRKKNWSLDHLPFANEWVLILDADERITPALHAEIEREFTNGPKHDGYYLNRKLIFLGKWLRWGGQYPSWNLRLLKHHAGRYEKLDTERLALAGDVEVHEHVILDGSAGWFKEPMLHLDFKDLSSFIDRHNRYSTWEAQMRQRLRDGGDLAGSIRPSLFGVPTQRKRWLKRIWVRLPFRPLLLFIYQYFLRAGFLDGRVGFIYALFKTKYEFETNCKMYEVQLRRKNG
ncbi:MAG: glycosyltransferase family 2 protein [Candidatus Nealsonbacteria bacterium]|nr:glycosyltransferase family 2 protein [Candidatus Nealsonbacteria bacterium]